MDTRKITSAFHRLMMNFMNIDLLILLKARQFTKFSIQIVDSITQVVFVMTLGAGILFVYTLANVKIGVPIHADQFTISMEKPIKERILSIDANSDAESLEASSLQQKLKYLQNQAQNIELNLKKMESQYKYFSEITRRSNSRVEELADFASEAAGGTVLDTPDTESYYEPWHQQMTLFGIPIWKANYFTPRKVIQPWTQAGECWAFKGSSGKIVIELAYPTLIDKVTLEHIPVSVSLTGSISSAPKDCVLYGLKDSIFVAMNNFMYDINGPSSQKFKLEDKDRYPIKIILLNVQSNWGHRDYTCIYRFKVHGKIADS